MPNPARTAAAALGALLLTLNLTPTAVAQCAPFDGVSRIENPTDDLITASALADLDSDGALDLIVSTWDGRELWILPGDGHGRFSADPTSTLALGGDAIQIEIADVTGNGFEDLLVLIAGPASGLRIFEGDGSLAPAGASTFVEIDEPLDVALGDIDGNGTVDLVALTGTVDFAFGVVDTTLEVRTGDGSGDFTGPFSISDPTLPDAVVDLLLADINADGAADLFVFESGFSAGAAADGALALADGLGSFGSATTLGIGGVFAAGLADLNADGFLDLVVDGDELAVYLGDGGTGYFLIYAEPGSGQPFGGAVNFGDLDADGNLDVVLPRFGSHLDSWLGDGTGALAFASRSVRGTDWQQSHIGDLDEDGQLDLLLSGLVGVASLFGDATGHFGRGTWFEPGGYWGRTPRVGDLNGDGNADVAVIDPNLAVVRIGLGNGGGDFALSTVPIDPVSIDSVLADFNNDGDDDLAIASLATDTVTLYLGDGLGAFTESGSVAIPQCVRIFGGDFNGDAQIDIVAVEALSTRLHFSAGDGAGGLGAPLVHERPVTHQDVVLGDFDGDGQPDLLSVGPSWSLARSVGNGTFENVGVDGPVDAAESATAADLDQDGHLDVVVSRGSLGGVRCHFGDGAGSFPVVTEHSGSGYSGALSVADFNADGWLDIVVSKGNGHFEIVLADGFGGVATYGRLTGYTGGFATVGDFDGDGTPDLLGPGTFLPNLCVAAEFRRGELNEDGAVGIDDGVALLTWLFTPPGVASFAPRCPDAADVNDDGVVDVADASALLAALFIAGAPPIPPPASACGLDPTPDPLLPCVAFDCP